MCSTQSRHADRPEPVLSPRDPDMLEGIPRAPADRMPPWREDGRTLQINEIFYSIEGEGLRVGQPTTFVRLARCNLRCFFCDTEFDTYTELEIAEIVAEVGRHTASWVCLTGGEPLGQNIVPLCRELRAADYRIHIETNGAIVPDPDLYNLVEHWTVSPKRKSIAGGLGYITELKYVVGKHFEEDMVEEDRAEYVYLQPESSKSEYIAKTLDVLKRHPEWRLSCRIHKMLDLP